MTRSEENALAVVLFILAVIVVLTGSYFVQKGIHSDPVVSDWKLEGVAYADGKLTCEYEDQNSKSTLKINFTGGELPGRSGQIKCPAEPNVNIVTTS